MDIIQKMFTVIEIVWNWLRSQQFLELVTATFYLWEKYRFWNNYSSYSQIVLLTYEVPLIVNRFSAERNITVHSSLWEFRISSNCRFCFITTHSSHLIQRFPMKFIFFNPSTICHWIKYEEKYFVTGISTLNFKC